MELRHREPGGRKGSAETPASAEKQAESHRSKHLHVPCPADRSLSEACLSLLPRCMDPNDDKTEKCR